MDPNWVVGLCVAFSFPTNWLKDFSLLSFLSAFGLGCVLLIIAVVTFDAGDALLDPATPSAKTTLADVSGLPMSGSIMLAGLTGHVGLPPMYTEMKTPSHFRRVLYLAFLAMFLMYAAVGVGGYALYGDGASILITQDMANAAGANDGLGQVFRYLVLGGITFKLFAGTPVCVLVLVDIVQDVYVERGHVLSEREADRWRFGIWGGTIVCAFVLLPYLQYTTALVGINSMLISVMLPLIFFLQLHARTMGWASILCYGCIIAVSGIMTVIISYADVLDFLKTLKAAQAV